MILQQALASVDLDTESLPQANLDVTNRVRTNPFPWRGQFSPQLAEHLLTAYAPRGGLVLDPFVGSGTSLLEAARLGLAASGAELNPAAALLAKVYSLANRNATAKAAAIREVQAGLVRALGYSSLSLFQEAVPLDRSTLEQNLIDLWNESGSGPAKDLAAALVVLADFHRDLDAGRIQDTWHRLQQTVHALPKSAAPITVHHADARSLPHDTRTVDLVLTSPPYINVHNYHQQYRRSVEALAFNVLAIARSEIGSNRQNRANRFLTVVQYSLDMSLALLEIARITRPEALSILVVGRESTVCGVRFFNGELIAELAVRTAGFRLERRQERVFRNRYGKSIYEDILHLRSTGDVTDETSALNAARSVAQEFLSATRQTFSPGSKEPLLDDALQRIPTISPSPMFGAQPATRST